MRNSSFKLVVAQTGAGKSTLIKSKIEEYACEGMPFIVIDIQGDMASLAVPKDKNNELEKMSVSIYTPASNLSENISINPFISKGKDVFDLQMKSNIIVDILNVCSKQEKLGLSSLIIDALYSNEINNFSELGNVLSNLIGFQFRVQDSLVEKAVRACNSLSNGIYGELFSEENHIDLDKLLSPHAVSVIYLAHLDKDSQQFFMQLFAREFHHFMMNEKVSSSPSGEINTKGVLVLDECKRFIPATSKPPAKEPLTFLFQEMRKFGFVPWLATQSPGKIDYECLGTTQEKYIGRLQAPQEIEKVLKFLKASKEDSKKLRLKIPNLRTGEFLEITNYVSVPRIFKSNNSLTINKPLSQEEIKKLSKSKTKNEENTNSLSFVEKENIKKYLALEYKVTIINPLSGLTDFFELNRILDKIAGVNKKDWFFQKRTKRNKAKKIISYERERILEVIENYEKFKNLVC